jgi:hypothetical protein
MKKLLKIAYSRKDDEESVLFLRKVNNLVKDGLEHYVKYYCQS